MRRPIDLNEDEFFKEGQTETSPIRINARYGTGKMLNVLSLREGLAIEIQHFELISDVRISHSLESPEHLLFCTCLTGDLKVHSAKWAKHIWSGFSGVEFLGHDPILSTEIQSRVPLQILSVYADPSFFTQVSETKKAELLQNLDELQHRTLGKSAIVRRSKALDSAMRSCAYQALQAAMNPLENGLFLQAKALELISFQLRQIDVMLGRRPALAPIRTSEIERIVWASDILQKEMSEPPDGVMLASRVGLSYGRLLRGFKEFFNMTPIEYLRAVRLQRAYDLVISRKQNVSEAAFSVGYSSLSHFTKAFRSEFGMNPRDCAKLGQRSKSVVSSKIT